MCLHTGLLVSHLAPHGSQVLIRQRLKCQPSHILVWRIQGHVLLAEFIFFCRPRTEVLIILLAATCRPVSIPSISSTFLLTRPDPPGHLESLFCFKPLLLLCHQPEKTLLLKGLMRLDTVHLENLLIIKSTVSQDIITGQYLLIVTVLGIRTGRILPTKGSYQWVSAWDHQPQERTVYMGKTN